LLKGVIAALWEEVKPEEIPVNVVFILKSEVQHLKYQLDMYRRAGKTVYVDMDFVAGLSDGEAAVAFLKNMGVDGIISVKMKNFHACRKFELPFVLRIFALDSRAVEKAFGQVLNNDVIIGAIIAGIGLALIFADKIPLLGRLPGDIVIKRKNFVFYFPLMTSILISVILTIILSLISRFFR